MIVPTVSGGLQLEWYSGALEIDLEMESPFEEVMLFYRDLDTGAWWHGRIGDEPESLDKLLWRVSLTG